jgi:hypothetical protein
MGIANVKGIFNPYYRYCIDEIKQLQTILKILYFTKLIQCMCIILMKVMHKWIKMIKMFPEDITYFQNILVLTY